VSNELVDGGLASRVSPPKGRFARGPLALNEADVGAHASVRTSDVLEVYAAALQAVSDGEDPHCRLHWPDGRVTGVDIARWVATPTACELALLDRLPGPVLDVGCGPGRHVLALNARGVECLGIDVLPTAVRLARRRGAAVMEGSVFGDLLPGRWQSALLLDGNIGIGADPVVLLRRIQELLRPGGDVLVELDTDEPGIRTLGFELATAELHSRPFRWTLVGLQGIASLAAITGYDIADVRDDGRRSFAHLIARGAGD
jgi:SAM-dependent methyltransferase